MKMSPWWAVENTLTTQHSTTLQERLYSSSALRNTDQSIMWEWQLTPVDVRWCNPATQLHTTQSSPLHQKKEIHSNLKIDSQGNEREESKWRFALRSEFWVFFKVLKQNTKCRKAGVLFRRGTIKAPRRAARQRDVSVAMSTRPHS